MSDMNMVRLKSIEKIMSDNFIAGEIIDNSVENEKFSYICVLVENGDWKHSHRLLDYLVENELKPICVDSIITDDDGSDTYSAKHIYRFKN